MDIWDASANSSICTEELEPSDSHNVVGQVVGMAGGWVTDGQSSLCVKSLPLSPSNLSPPPSQK